MKEIQVWPLQVQFAFWESIISISDWIKSGIKIGEDSYRICDFFKEGNYESDRWQFGLELLESLGYIKQEEPDSGDDLIVTFVKQIPSYDDLQEQVSVSLHDFVDKHGYPNDIFMGNE